MKSCQVCKREYIADRKVCWCDETHVKQAGTEQDRYIGKMIDGRFEVLSKLGRGAMGCVYLAEQIDVHKRIALKILDYQFATDAGYVNQFCAVARLATGLRHPNIATVIDFDQTTDGCLFIAMDYVDGETLDRLIERTGRLPVSQALQFGAQIAGGLAAAHRRGVLHLDIRPRNILVIADGAMVKITDFGLPRHQPGSSSGWLAQSEVALATPEYTAPEQLSGGSPTEQADIYALGIVLYQMLTGEVPFRASTQLGTLLCQINEAPLPVRQLRAEVPAAVESLVMRALAKKPAKRYSTIARMAKELRQADKSLGAQSGARFPLALRDSDPAIARYGLHRKAASAAAVGALACAGYFVFNWESAPVSSAPASAISRSETPWPETGPSTGTAVVISTASGAGPDSLNALSSGIGKIEERVIESVTPARAVKQPLKNLLAIKARQPGLTIAAEEKQITETPPPLMEMQSAQRALAAPLPQLPQQLPPPPLVKLDEPEPPS